MSTKKVDKPILTPKGQAAHLERLEERLKKLESALVERERELEQRERELEAREQAVNEREQTLVQRETQSEPAKKSAPKKRPKPTTAQPSLVIADLDTSTSPTVPEATVPNSPKTVSLTPHPVSNLPITPSVKTETVSALPTFNVPEFSGYASLPISPVIWANPFVLETPPLENAPASPFTTTAPTPLAPNPSMPLPASSSEKKGKKQKKKEISPFKNPLRYILVNRRTIGIGLAVTMFNAGIAGYFAYLGRDVVATRIATQTNAVQRKSVALQAAQLDPFRSLRDKLLEQDPCRSGYAYQIIAKRYKTFAEQTPSRQLEVLALDPRIHSNINILAEGGTLERGVCNLFK